MLIVHNGTCSMYCNLLTDIRIAKDSGYDGIEILGSKLRRYLEQGFSPESLIPHLDGITPVAIGYVQDIERWEPEDRDALMVECEEMCALAQTLGMQFVQVLTGPIGPGFGADAPACYEAIDAMPWSSLMEVTTENLSELADIAANHNVSLYLEPLSWTRIHTLDHARELIEGAGRGNVGLIIDFWHLWSSGVTSADIATLDKGMIAGVHFCDSLELADGPVTQELRDVWPGGGHIPLKEWVDAIVSTGYDGWMAAELWSAKYWEMDPWQVSANLAGMMRYLLL